jgi:hypothetical protein
VVVVIVVEAVEAEEATVVAADLVVQDNHRL